MKNEISNMNVISTIVEKLPEDLKLGWYRKLSKPTTSITPANKFDRLLSYLQVERDAFEYNSQNTILKSIHKRKFSLNEPAKCFIHPTATHQITECYTFQSKNNQGRIDMVKEKNLCLSCLKAGHKMSICRTAKRCSIGKCNEMHNEILHDAFAEVITLHLFVNKTDLQTDPLLLIMNIGVDGHSESATVL